jgi:hypothetical protein
VPYELRIIKGDASSELVKCKSLKTCFQSNLLEKIGHIRSPDWVPVSFAEHVQTTLISLVYWAYPAPMSGPNMSGQPIFS